MFHLFDECGGYKGRGTIGSTLRDNRSSVFCDERRAFKGGTYQVYTRELKAFRQCDEGYTGEIERSRLQCLKTDSSSQQAWTKAAQQPEERATCTLSQLNCSTLYIGGQWLVQDLFKRKTRRVENTCSIFSSWLSMHHPFFFAVHKPFWGILYSL